MNRPHRLARVTTFWLVCGLLLAAVGCGSQAALPTVASIDMALTADAQTQNAPPPGFATVSFAPIDRNLERQPHSHAAVSLSFEGVYADTGEATSGTVAADIYSNELTGERRVVVRASGEAFSATTARNVEGVRLGNDFYFVDQNGVCNVVTEDPARRRVAELTAGSLIGGVRAAQFSPTRRISGGIEEWQFAFLPGDVNPPEIQMTQGGSVAVASGELWIAIGLNAVHSYALTLNLNSVIVPTFQRDRQISGTLRVTYQLIEVNQPYNISIPFGC